MREHNIYKRKHLESWGYKIYPWGYKNIRAVKGTEEIIGTINKVHKAVFMY